MSKVNVLFATFPYGNWLHPDVAYWLVKTVAKAKQDPRIGEVFDFRAADTPITMSRNRCLKEALRLGADFVCMVDSDMSPDLPLPGAKPFWDTAFDFALASRDAGKPCLIAAPYCGPPPWENVYIFQWGAKQSDHPNADLSLDQLSREDAARRAGIEPVAALPTGLILIDTRILLALPKPYFKYEYKDEEESEKASTEDVYFTRNVALAGFPVYCLWDSWAGHWKDKRVGKPQLLTMDAVQEKFHEAILSGRKSDERIFYVNAGLPGGSPPPGSAVVPTTANGHAKPKKKTPARAR